MEKKESSYTVGENVNWWSHCRKEYEVSSKKTRVTVWYNDMTPGHTFGQKYNSKRYVHPYVHSSTIYNSQDMETT